MNLLREYIRELLNEDAMGFVHDLAAASEEFGEEGQPFFGGDPGKGGGKAIKRAFNANADHRWLSTLDTVHWGDVYGFAELVGRGKDELSTSMTLPSENFIPLGGTNTGLWVKGRITLAAHDMDQLFTGHAGDYIGPKAPGTPEEQEHRKKSSGINKYPKISRDYSRYGGLKRGNKYHEDILSKAPYVLDQSTWKKRERGGNPTEALVDNWKPVGLIADWEIIQLLKKMKNNRDVEDELEEIPPGKLGKLMKLAQEMDIPVFDRERNILWSPE